MTKKKPRLINHQRDERKGSSHEKSWVGLRPTSNWVKEGNRSVLDLLTARNCA